jgi:hypothetical protein
MGTGTGSGGETALFKGAVDCCINEAGGDSMTDVEDTAGGAVGGCCASVTFASMALVG